MKKSIKNNKAKGFTIVELLVVIVVIGILAAISIVSYSGVANKAKNVQALSAAADVKSGIEFAASENGNIYYMSQAKIKEYITLPANVTFSTSKPTAASFDSSTNPPTVKISVRPCLSTNETFDTGATPVVPDPRTTSTYLTTTADSAKIEYWDPSGTPNVKSIYAGKKAGNITDTKTGGTPVTYIEGNCSNTYIPLN